MSFKKPQNCLTGKIKNAQFLVSTADTAIPYQTFSYVSTKERGFSESNGAKLQLYF